LLAELETISRLKRESCRALVKEAKKQTAYKWLESVPGLGAISIAQVIAAVGSPFRFRTKRQFWTYCGLAVITRSSADYEFVADGLVRRKSAHSETRGLNENYNHRLKKVFKTAALAALKKEPFSDYYGHQIKRGLKAELARVQLARKIAAIALAVWKKAQKFDAKQVMKQAA
jgi:transposase